MQRMMLPLAICLVLLLALTGLPAAAEPGTSLTIHKFYDYNCDGVENGPDYGLSGWEFEVTGPAGY